MADAKHRLAYALLRATYGDFRRGDIERARARSEEALKLAHLLERPSETAMAHVALLRCALASGGAKDIEHQRDALRRVSMTQIAAHVRKAAEPLLIPMKIPAAKRRPIAAAAGNEVGAPWNW